MFTNQVNINQIQTLYNYILILLLDILILNLLCKSFDYTYKSINVKKFVSYCYNNNRLINLL